MGAGKNDSSNNIAFIMRRIPHYRLPFYSLFIEQNRQLNVTIYYGIQERPGASGLLHTSHYTFAKKLRSVEVGPLIFQAELIRSGIVDRYQLVIFEGALSIVSSLLILFLRRQLGKKNIIWTKGWFGETRSLRLDYQLRKYYLSLADSYIVYGNSSKRELQKYDVDVARITVAQNTVDVKDIMTGKYVNSQLGSDNQPINEIIYSKVPYVFNIGRIILRKRVDDLIDAFERLNRSRSRMVQLVIAGSGPELERLEKKVRHLQLKNVRFLGTITDAESKMLYANCLFCVFPGSVGLSLNEAMAAGKAVICADEPGPDSELLVHNRNGLRYEKGNIKELATFMKSLINDQGLADKFGERAFETISQKATLNNMVSMFSAAVHRCLV